MNAAEQFAVFAAYCDMTPDELVAYLREHVGRWCSRCDRYCRPDEFPGAERVCAACLD